MEEADNFFGSQEKLREEFFLIEYKKSSERTFDFITKLAYLTFHEVDWSL